MATRLRLQMSAGMDGKALATFDRMRSAGRGDLQRAVDSAIRRRGQAAVNAVRASIRSAEMPAIPSRGGGKSSGLRGRVAAAVRVSTAGGALRIFVDGDKVDPQYGTSLVLALNGMTRLRHPTFGRRGRGQWVVQRGTREHFYSSLAPFERQWRADVEKALDDYAARIGG